MTESSLIRFKTIPTMCNLTLSKNTIQFLLCESVIVIDVAIPNRYKLGICF